MCEFDVVVADPPWYVDFYQAFVLRSSHILREGGALLLSMLPWLTRPGAVQDRAEVLSFASRAGFDLVDCQSARIGYQSPRFEQTALAVHGIFCRQWRYGDLYRFRKTNEPSPALTVKVPLGEEPDPSAWREFAGALALAGVPRVDLLPGGGVRALKMLGRSIRSHLEEYPLFQ